MSFGGGIPSVADLRHAEESECFAALARSSSEWSERNAERLRSYVDPSATEPLRQWSRRWEYPFVASALAGTEARSVLDAGSGFTFFPFYLAGPHHTSSVTCVDADDLGDLFAGAAREETSGSVSFQRGDLRAIPLGNGEVDAAYCLSVLEHTSDYPAIVDELHRVIAPGGLLVVTFDVSLDARADIGVAAAEELVATLAAFFTAVDLPRDIAAQAHRADILTTRYSASLDPSRLPWAHPFLSAVKSSIKHRRLPLVRMLDLTCYGGVLRRP